MKKNSWNLWANGNNQSTIGKEYKANQKTVSIIDQDRNYWNWDAWKSRSNQTFKIGLPVDSIQ